MNAEELKVQPGDVITQPNGEGAWDVIKILEVDNYSDGSSGAHCLVYVATANKPDVAAIAGLTTEIMHAPIAAESFGNGWERVGNFPVVEEELEGFFEYLKLTDFARYLSATGQDANELFQRAYAHYLRANELADLEQRVEAIAEYSEALDLYPYFYEAIDNRALTNMELGNYGEALDDFEQSLWVNPDGGTAHLSKGECLMRLGLLDDADAVFREGITRFPERAGDYEILIARVDALRGAA